MFDVGSGGQDVEEGRRSMIASSDKLHLQASDAELTWLCGANIVVGGGAAVDQR